VHFKLTGGTTLSLQVTENGFPAQSIVYYGKSKTQYTGSADPIRLQPDPVAARFPDQPSLRQNDQEPASFSRGRFPAIAKFLA